MSIFLGFDFGYKRIGVAVGQDVTTHSRPLNTLAANQGKPIWQEIEKLLELWQPKAVIVGLPTCIDDSELYTTEAAKRFAAELSERFSLPVHLVDERLTTIEARSLLFEEGGYRKIKKSNVDSVAACLILDQWLQQSK